MPDNSDYPPLAPWRVGIKARCPRCGEGKLFDGFLNPLEFGALDANEVELLAYLQHESPMPHPELAAFAARHGVAA